MSTDDNPKPMSPDDDLVTLDLTDDERRLLLRGLRLLPQSDLTQGLIDKVKVADDE